MINNIPSFYFKRAFCSFHTY